MDRRKDFEKKTEKKHTSSNQIYLKKSTKKSNSLNRIATKILWKFHTEMETSTEKQLPVSNRSCHLLSKAVKRVDKFQQTCQPETFSNLDLVSELNLVATNDTSCQTEFQGIVKPII